LHYTPWSQSHRKSHSIYELTTQGGATNFAHIIGVSEALGDYCLLGGLAVNCNVEPVYTLDAKFVASSIPILPARTSKLRIQLTTDKRYQDFLPRAVYAEVLGVRAKVASLEDVARGKLWAYSDPQRRLSRRKKDEQDLIRRAKAYPELKSLYRLQRTRLTRQPRSNNHLQPSSVYNLKLQEAGDTLRMTPSTKHRWYLIALLALLCAPAYATVMITSVNPSPRPPQVLATSVTWTVTASDTNPGPLTFQFNVALPQQTFNLVRDFNVGTLESDIWTSQPFVWVPTAVEGTYQIQVVIKDFTSGETASKTMTYKVEPLVTGSTPVVVKTAHPLVALFSAPSCPAGSAMRVRFQPQSMSSPATTTNYVRCHPPASMNFEIAGMYPSTTYNMFSETKVRGAITNGHTVNFTTGAIPADIPIPGFMVNVITPQTDRTDGVILQNSLRFGATAIYPAVATDLAGNVIWYYYPGQNSFITRPLAGGTMLTYQSGPSWGPSPESLQLVRQIDLAGNIIKETNIGAIGQQLLAMGATDARMCSTIALPAPIGSACLDTFHHDAIQTLPDGGAAVLLAVEKIFPPGTQGDTTGLPVDIIGDMIVVLDKNWQVTWYFDVFQHDSGAPQLDINRTAVLGNTCTKGVAPGCSPVFLTTAGISPLAKDWLHTNSLYYWPATKDIVWSSRHQDWVMKVDYNNGMGTGNILWRMGPCGDFSFNNIYNDPWPWFSHQHEFGMENNGAGPATVFDNGNTRHSKPGSSTGCMQGVGYGNSRGMALAIDETKMEVTPMLSVDLGVFAEAMGSAQLLSDGDYYFQTGDISSSGTQILNIEGPFAYRGWQMPNLYNPPIT